jgi:hypothetical protein
MLFIKGTGTATAKVIADIRNILQLDVNNAPCIMGTFNRTNISYEGKLGWIVRLFRNAIANPSDYNIMHSPIQRQFGKKT